MQRADVIVVGGGPAGAATAWHLARAGWDVLVLERARFPRAKPCAECVSVAATRQLAEMGVLPALERAGVARLRGMVVRAPNGAEIVGDFASPTLAGRGWAPAHERSVAVRRELLDPILLDAARSAGARVEMLTRVADVERDAHGRVMGVRVDGIHGDRLYRAPLVVGADGLRSVIARRLDLSRRARWPRRVAVVSHWRGVHGVGEYGEMHVERDGFVGIADVGRGITTVAMVVPARRGRDMGGDPGTFQHDWLRAHPHLAPRFADAERVAAVSTTGPFAVRCKRAWAPGAALVGDAADFFDPFTGEGIYTAMRGAELLADALGESFASRGHGAALDRALERYDLARRDEFRDKWRIERMIAAAVARPALIDRAASVLARRKDMADLLVGATGHVVPAREVLRLRYVAALFLRPALFAPPPTTPAASAREATA